MTALEKLAAFVVKRGIAAPARDLVARHVVDIAGAWAAGAAAPEGAAITSFPWSRALADRVGRNAALVRLSECDDIHLSAMITAGSVAVSAALTMGAELKSTGADIADAITAGYEAMVRFGLAIDGAAVLYRGIWPTYFAAPIGAAAVAARLFNLDEAKTTHALALALHLSAPTAGHQHGAFTSRWLAFGMMAKNGVAAAEAAHAGFIGDADILEGRWPGAFGITPDLALLAPHETRPAIMDVSFKPWVAARQTMAASQALSELLQEGLKASEISAIEVALPPPQVKMVDHGVSLGDRTSFLTSLPYHLAIAAFAPERRFDATQNPKDVPTDVSAVMAKVKITGDDALLAHYPKTWPAHVRVALPGGVKELTITSIPGDPGRPFNDMDAGEKFRRIVGPKAGQGLMVAQEALSKPGGAAILLDLLG